MIVDSFDYIACYKGLHPNLDKAIDWLNSHPLAAQVRKSIMPAFAEGLELKAAALQNDAGLVGAVYYFRNNSIDLHL